MRKSSLEEKIYIILILISFVFLGFAAILSHSVKTETRNDGSAMELEIKDIEVSNKGVEYRFMLPELGNRNYLGFFTFHKSVEVYVDNIRVYIFDRASSSLSNSPGYCYNLVRMDESYRGKEIRIILKAAYKKVKMDVPKIMCGSYSELTYKVVREGMPDFVLCVIILIIGLVAVVTHFMMKKRADIGNRLLYLGVFAINLGIWSLNETTMLKLFMDAGATNMYLAFMSLATMPIPFMFFLREAYKSKKNKLWDSAFYVSAAVVIINLLLQLTGIADFSRTLLLTHISLLFNLVIVIATTFFEIRNGNLTRTMEINIVCMLIIATATICDVVAYYLGTEDGNIFGRLGFLVYIIVLSIDSLGNSFELIRIGKKSSVYKNLAYSDVLTGMKNRAAYNSVIERLKDKNQLENTAIVMMDLNDLKKCNDYFGHEMGDKYIEAAAESIKKHFAKYGSGYRIGGDEFCVIVKDFNSCPIDEIINSIDQDMEKQRIEQDCDYMSIAHGYAVFDKRFDADLDETRDRADKLMYAHKQSYKKGGTIRK